MMASSFVLRRATAFGDSVSAYPQRQRRGQAIKITGNIKRANWDTGTYDTFGTYVMLQFRPEGAAEYQNVRLVWDKGDGATTYVTAERTGTWRYQFNGDSISGPSSSKDVFVLVPHCRRPWAAHAGR